MRATPIRPLPTTARPSPNSNRIRASYLSLAAAFVAKGDETAASVALARFVEEHPDHRNGRFYYAEILHRLGKSHEAQAQFERTVADLQQEAKCDYAQLVHCHGRLMELGEEEEDEYQLHLNRGMGLYWLGKGTLNLDKDEELSPEALFCKAAGELSAAHAPSPDEARPSWYLYCISRNLGQATPARRSLSEAREAAPFSVMTPAEQRNLELAGPTF